MSLTIYHNPRCSKSRATLALLEQSTTPYSVVEYLKNPPDATTLRAILGALDKRAVDLVRKGETPWTDAALGDDADDEAVIALMLEHPIIIERPIVTRDAAAGGGAVIGRPPENVLQLLDQ